jgi:hypothetical protein
MIMPAEKNFWLVHQSSLTILPAVICEQVMDEMNENFYLVSISFTLVSDFLHAVTSYDMGLPSLLSIRRNVWCGFLSPFKIHRLSRIWTRDLRYSGKHTNPYTTEETIWNPNWTSVLKSLLLLLLFFSARTDWRPSRTSNSSRTSMWKQLETLIVR